MHSTHAHTHTDAIFLHKHTRMHIHTHVHTDSDRYRDTRIETNNIKFSVQAVQMLKLAEMQFH